MPVIRTFSINVSKDVRTRGYFSKPKGVREQKSLRNSALKEMFTTKKRKYVKRGERGNLKLKIYFFHFSQITFKFTKSRNIRCVGSMHRCIGVWNKQNILIALMMVLAGFCEKSITNSQSVHHYPRRLWYPSLDNFCR
jgi:hypothetical protein